MKQIKQAAVHVRQKIAIPFIDLIIGKTMSKKLLVFFLATLFVIKSVLTGDQWVTIAEWYFGSQGAVDIAEAITNNYKKRGGDS